MHKLLLISNSTNAGEAYLAYTLSEIKSFLGNINEVLFIPYAGVTFSWDDYEAKVQESLTNIDIKVKGIHRFDDPIKAIEKAHAIMVGGGNTFQLVATMQKNNLFDVIRKKVANGMPYIGWSAGSNVACPSMKTTNDMPIMEPQSFDTLNLVPFQINPHYLDANPEGHAGETREQRIIEFLEVNKNKTVVGLREGTMLKITENTINLIGSRSCRIFRYNENPIELNNTDDLAFLLRT